MKLFIFMCISIGFFGTIFEGTQTKWSFSKWNQRLLYLVSAWGWPHVLNVFIFQQTVQYIVEILEIIDTYYWVLTLKLKQTGGTHEVLQICYAARVCAAAASSYWVYTRRLHSADIRCHLMCGRRVAVWNRSWRPALWIISRRWPFVVFVVDTLVCPAPSSSLPDYPLCLFCLLSSYTLLLCLLLCLCSPSSTSPPSAHYRMINILLSRLVI